MPGSRDPLPDWRTSAERHVRLGAERPGVHHATPARDPVGEHQPRWTFCVWMHAVSPYGRVVGERERLSEVRDAIEARNRPEQLLHEMSSPGFAFSTRVGAR